MTTVNDHYFDSYCPPLAPTPPAVGAPPDAILRYPAAFLDDIDATSLWDVLSYGLIESDHVPTEGMWWGGPFYRVHANFDAEDAGEVRFWFGTDRRACTEALKPSIELLDAWRRERSNRPPVSLGEGDTTA